MAGATETQKQENGSRLTFESFIERGKFPSKDLIETVYPKVPDKWINTYKLQAEALKKYLGSNKGYLYSRDVGIMPIIERFAKQHMGVSSKDAWNPMDIVMVKKTEEKKIIQEVEKISKLSLTPTDRLIKLNLYMKDLLKQKILLPISLKEIKVGVKQANIQESNLDKKSKGVKFKLIPGSLKCDLDVSQPPLLDTGEFTFKFQIDDESVKVQIRSFRYSIASTGPQTDLTPIGRQSGAKLGKVSVQAMDPFLLKLGLKKPLSPTQDPMIAVDGKFKENQIKFWNNFYNEIKNVKIEGENVDFDAPIDLGKKVVNLNDIIEFSLKNKDKPNVLGRLYSKLITLRYIKLYQQISQKNKFDEWLSILYFGAKKEFSDTNGPFIKIY